MIKRKSFLKEGNIQDIKERNYLGVLPLDIDNICLVETAGKRVTVIILMTRGDWCWLGQVLVGTVPISAKRFAIWRH